MIDSSKKESQLLEHLQSIERSMQESKLRISDLKKKLDAEETQLIGLKISKDEIRDQLRRYLDSLPSQSEFEAIQDKLDKEFLSRLDYLLKKV